MSKDKWMVFKNYLHNELGITKEDIRVWIKEAVLEVAEGLVKQEWGKFKIKDLIDDMIVSDNYWGRIGLKEEMKKLIAQELAKEICLINRSEINKLLQNQKE